MKLLLDSSHKAKLKQIIKDFPKSPGCYLWKNKAEKIIYVGKAVNLNSRVSSYINNFDRVEKKIQNMVTLAESVEFITTDSEVESLILENNLIKKYRPKYNTRLKDDKSYISIAIDWYKPIPSVKVVREKKDPKSEYYGPFPDSFPVYKVLKNLRRIYPYCTNLPREINKKDFELSNLKDKRPCLNHYIGLCPGICAAKISKTEYRKNIKGIRDFLKGKKYKVIENLKKQMEKSRKQLKFEDAARYRDKIKALEYVTQHIKIDYSVDEVKLKMLKEEKAIFANKELYEKLDSPLLDANKVSQKSRIECYDISNIQGTNAVGSMVVFAGGKKSAKDYRKFKIRTKSTPDDFAMMREVLERRLKYLTDSYKVAKSAESKTENLKVKNDKANKKETKNSVDKSPESLEIAPDLVIIDGGKGQLSAAHDIFDTFDDENIKNIQIVGLAKREEEIFKYDGEEFEMIRLPRRSEALYLVQRIRDEAHRFAVGYHRTLRSKGQTKSVLDDIPGVGKVTKHRLIQAFGSLKRIQNANPKELASIVRNKKTLNSLLKVLKIQKT